MKVESTPPSRRCLYESTLEVAILYESTLEVALVIHVAMALEILRPIGVKGLQHVRTPLADVTVFAQYGVQ